MLSNSAVQHPPDYNKNPGFQEKTGMGTKKSVTFSLQPASNVLNGQFIVGTRRISMNEPLHVTDAAFEKVVLNSKLPVVVDFWAPWCGPCKMVAPVLDKIAQEQAGKLVIAKVNTDENPEWATRYEVQGIPTMLFVVNGKVVHQQVGALPEKMLRIVMDQFLKVAQAMNQPIANPIV
jgi:thioredoxin 1